ncbi:MAG TPA: CRISPR-associated endonuclease Cas2 [Defluviitaleaceae bacterium]|nr:CRISPR-associated endonuclease Cas2 [Candidatus Epulonipiscium sp.]HQD51116.1 CRISPR-associated endonuclease Cas2 [Defluviitaleaceae bacterium]
MYIILVYDINLENNIGQRVLRKTFKTCKKYLHHVQNSVFEGEITKVQLAKLKVELGEYIRKDVDSVIVFKARTEKWLDKEFWGKEEDLTSNFL